jgi:BASS family bile acid:Na+ symporter
LSFSLFAAITGWSPGGGERGHRILLAPGTGIRNIPAAFLVGAQNFPEPEVVVVILATTLAGTFLLAPAIGFIGRHRTPHSRPALEDADSDQHPTGKNQYHEPTAPGKT